ncbi:MAG: NAD-dependent malic enzyme [Proteobacteria bacterium]|nr:NAD-dependent malic enzyme [Pseudomonadota bacterium]
MPRYQYKEIDGKKYLETSLSDYSLISVPLLNKGMAFSDEERKEFNLYGLIPPHQSNLTEQRQRSYQALQRKNTNLEKYIYLRDLQDSNETLFYSLLSEYIEELLPLVYTPVVGEACEMFSHIYRRPRGVFITYPNRDYIDQTLKNIRFDDVEAIVVSDGERILGLGDQGAGGMGIPIGKLSLYTACAGIHPATTLPILLDTGTDNVDRINDPLYIGWRHTRVRGQEYDDFLEQFVTAVHKRFPHVLLQFEDFAQRNAYPLLERYRDRLCTFNDDIQGTAAVTVGALLAAVDVTGVPLKDQRIVVVGAGSAGCGISHLILNAMVQQGLTEQEARRHFYLVDRDGLLVEGMPDLKPFQTLFAQDRNAVANWKNENASFIGFTDVVHNVRPTLLIGVSGQAGIFTENIVREMAKNVERPIIFPLSNPTDHCEAKPQDIMNWTDGRAIVGTGSPFGTVTRNGKPFHIDQTNNSYIFPGVGLGLISVKAKRVTDKMFLMAAQALAACSPAKSDKNANLLPPLKQIREVSYQVALAVATEAINEGLADPIPLDQLPNVIKNKMWDPVYLPYKRIESI